MENDLYFNPDGTLHISKSLFNEWIVKVPTSRHRLAKNGTCSLTLVDYEYALPTRKGIVYIDMSNKSYVVLPNHVLQDFPPEAKAHAGVPRSIIVFNVKQILMARKMDVVKISKRT